MGVFHRLFGSRPTRLFKPSDVGNSTREGENFTEKDIAEQFEHDVIIVGGGTAGCCLAARLSEDPLVRVLLLEAGHSGRRNPFIRVPVFQAKTWGGSIDYNLQTVPQANLGGTRHTLIRGKALGGCSNVNAMISQLCSPSDYDEWASICSGEAGADGWRWDNFKQYFTKFEKFIPNPDVPLKEPRLPLRGSTGPLSTGFFGHIGDVTNRFVAACRAVGIPVLPDMNTPGGTIGVARPVTFISPEGERVTAEAAYLTDDVLKRPNLKVAVGARVTRILISGAEKRATGVAFADDVPQGGRRRTYIARAKREVVMAAGAIHTPQLLLLSGIGPDSPSTNHILPGVGCSLMDHNNVSMVFRTKPDPSVYFSVDMVGKGISLLECTTFGGEAAAFIRSDDPSLFPEEKIVAPGPSDRPDIEIFSCPVGIRNGVVIPSPPGDLMSLSTILLRPTSQGTIKLHSLDPFDPPLIDPNYLSTQHDIDVLTRAVRLMSRLIKTEPLSPIVVHDDGNPLLDHGVDKLNDEDLTAFLRKQGGTTSHPTSTVRMAPLSKGGCVDPFLRIHGIPNLRVADASIMPTIVSGHPIATVFAIAEKASDMIKASFD